MKRHQGMKLLHAILFFLPALLAVACGGDQRMASKTAAEHRDGHAKAVPVTSGPVHGRHDHGSHHATTATAADPHAGHDMTAGGAAGTDHTAVSHGSPATGGHAGHDTAPGSRGDHAGHATSSPAGGHDQHAGMQHAPAGDADPHAQHRQPAISTPVDHSQHGATAAAPVLSAAPRSNTEMARLEPASSLQPDAFDAPAAVAVAEAARAGLGGNPVENSSASAVYTCPMHPEVTSGHPGSCPKCGMALVKKN